jgi:sugar lactone lactonase YvrE
MEFSKGIQEVRIEVDLDSLQNARFIEGMQGCENLWLDSSGLGLYVTTLDGYIHYLDGPSRDIITIRQSLKVGSSVTGICRLSDSLLATVINENAPEDWMEIGAAVNLLTMSLKSVQRITRDFPAANGICADRQGNIYFASSNFNFFDPHGNIYLMKRDPAGNYSDPTPLFPDAGLANGLYYDKAQDLIYFSNTMGGVFSFQPGGLEYHREYLKTRFMEACDDLCTDPAGNLWMTDPGYSTVKVFNPGTNRLVRFVIKGIGQTSSCRIRHEGGKEIIYLTELKKKQKPMTPIFDGRGVLILPAEELLRLVKPAPSHE